MKTTIVYNAKGNRLVAITEQGGRFSARLYVNAREGVQNATATLDNWKGKTMCGAQRWAEKILNP